MAATLQRAAGGNQLQYNSVSRPACAKLPDESSIIFIASRHILRGARHEIKRHRARKGVKRSAEADGGGVCALALRTC